MQVWTRSSFVPEFQRATTAEQRLQQPCTFVREILIWTDTGLTILPSCRGRVELENRYHAVCEVLLVPGEDLAKVSGASGELGADSRRPWAGCWPWCLDGAVRRALHASQGDAYSTCLPPTCPLRALRTARLRTHVRHVTLGRRVQGGCTRANGGLPAHTQIGAAHVLLGRHGGAMGMAGTSAAASAEMVVRRVDDDGVRWRSARWVGAAEWEIREEMSRSKRAEARRQSGRWPGQQRRDASHGSSRPSAGVPLGDAARDGDGGAGGEIGCGRTLRGREHRGNMEARRCAGPPPPGFLSPHGCCSGGCLYPHTRPTRGVRQIADLTLSASCLIAR